MWCRKLITLCTCVVLLSSDVVHGKYIYQSDVQRSIGQNKVVATWEEAKTHCEDAGATLASPIDKKLLKHMLSYIDVNNHTNPYFIGIKAKYNPQPEFYSAEGVLLDDLPEVVLDMIDQLDPRDGDCLAMNRDRIRVVPCWKRYPYVCYTKLKSNEPEVEKTVKPTEVASTIESATKVSPTTESTTKVSPTTESTTKVSPTTKSTTKVSPTTESTTKVSPTTESSTKNTTTTEIVAETTIAPECDYEGYKYYPATGRCYHLHTNEETWYDAKKTCDDEGGYLVIVNDYVEAMTLVNIMKDNNLSAFWIGLRDKTGKNDWRSIHDDPIDKLYLRATNGVFYGHPNTCGFISYNNVIDRYPCYTQDTFLCEKSP